MGTVDNARFAKDYLYHELHMCTLGLLLHFTLILTHLLSVTSLAMPGSCLMFAAATISLPLSLPAAEVITGDVVTETVDFVVTTILL
jgi:hypothetical protein